MGEHTRQDPRREGFMGRLTELKAGPSDAQRARAEAAKVALKRDLEQQVRCAGFAEHLPLICVLPVPMRSDACPGVVAVPSAPAVAVLL